MCAQAYHLKTCELKVLVHSNNHRLNTLEHTAIIPMYKLHSTDRRQTQDSLKLQTCSRKKNHSSTERQYKTYTLTYYIREQHRDKEQKDKEQQ